MNNDRIDKADVLQGTLILLVLRTLEALGPLHGYGIARRIEQISKDVLQLNQGTLYPALLRMEQEGWISSKWGASEKKRKAKLSAEEPLILNNGVNPSGGGAGTLVVSNACGGLNPLWAAGDLMLIADHINLLGDSPLIGPNDERLGPRFPDLSTAYDSSLRDVARAVASGRGITLREGVYVAVAGPNLETRAEYRFLRGIGADAVGMSTVPEVLVAVHAGMRVLGISIITDMCLPDALEPATLERIIAVANRAEPGLTELVRGVLEQL